MAESLDVPGRLAEGRPAVDNTQDYVWACRLLGYQNPDLTLHPAQVRDWYSSEDGLDLRALDADRAALAAVAAATEDALQLQEQQLDTLAGAWQGRGGEASREFLLRHGQTSSAAAASVRSAVDALTALRDDLWQGVDDKVNAAVAIDDRRQTERGEWLAAAQTVTTGAGDRAVASELVDQQVKPFVDNDIRADWLSAMKAAMASVAAAFDAATAALTAAPAAVFEMPGDLGPAGAPAVSAPPTAEPGVITAPAALASPPPASSPMLAASSMPPTAPAFAAAPEPAMAAPPVAPMPATAPAASAPPAMPTMPPMPSLGELGGGLTGAAGGLAGLGKQLADAFGGLPDGPDDELPDPAEVKEESGDDEAAPDDEEPEEDPVEEDEEHPDVEPDDNCEEEPADEPPPPEPAPTAAPLPPPPEPAVEPAPPEHVVPPPPPNSEPVEAETPCEIAADELPQAGPR
jgi:hypothetical protein